MPDHGYDDIKHGLRQTPASIPPKYFYDQRGSALFEAITQLPEYYPTRTENALMHKHADAMAQACAATGPVLVDAAVDPSGYAAQIKALRG